MNIFKFLKKNNAKIILLLLFLLYCLYIRTEIIHTREKKYMTYMGTSFIYIITLIYVIIYRRVSAWDSNYSLIIDKILRNE